MCSAEAFSDVRVIRVWEQLTGIKHVNHSRILRRLTVHGLSAKASKDENS